MRPAVFSILAADTDGICEAQTLGAAGNLVINGVLLDRAATTYGTNRAVFPGLERLISISSTGNLAGINFTVTGFDINLRPVSQTIAGPNNGTVQTTTYFHIVNSVAASAAVGTNVTVGSGTAALTNWYMFDVAQSQASPSYFIDVTGTVTYTLEGTRSQDLTAVSLFGTTGDAFNTTGLYYGLCGYRVRMASGSTGSVVANFIPAKEI